MGLSDLGLLELKKGAKGCTNKRLRRKQRCIRRQKTEISSQDERPKGRGIEPGKIKMIRGPRFYDLSPSAMIGGETFVFLLNCNTPLLAAGLSCLLGSSQEGQEA